MIIVSSCVAQQCTLVRISECRLFTVIRDTIISDMLHNIQYPMCNATTALYFRLTLLSLSKGNWIQFHIVKMGAILCTNAILKSFNHFNNFNNMSDIYNPSFIFTWHATHLRLWEAAAEGPGQRRRQSAWFWYTTLLRFNIWKYNINFCWHRIP